MSHTLNTPATASELVELYADSQGAAYRLRGHTFPMQNRNGVMLLKLTNMITVRVYNGRDAVDLMVRQYNKMYFRK